MDETLPPEVVHGLSAARRAEVETWWASLDVASRGEFRTLWDARSESTAHYATIEDGRTKWHALPIRLCAKFVDPEDAREHAMWKRDLLEYVNAHEEVRFFLLERTFHICRAHAVAREVVRAGVIPASFECPVDSAECPFARALALEPGRSIVLGRMR